MAIQHLGTWCHFWLVEQTKALGIAREVCQSLATSSSNPTGNAISQGTSAAP